MFIKIISLPVTYYISGIFFILSFLLSLIMKKPILNNILTGIIGSLTFTSIWVFIVKILTYLLTNEELASCFNIDLSKNLSDSTISYNATDDDDLTLNDMYKNDMNHLNNNYQNIDNTNSENEYSSFLSDLNDSDTFNREFDSDSKVHHDGTFDFTINGKTLKTTPLDGAKAIQKVLRDDIED